jgi:hypothetical protein
MLTYAALSRQQAEGRLGAYADLCRRMLTFADVCCTEQAAGRGAVGSVRICELNMSLSYDIARFFPAPSAAPSGAPLNSLY